jgi:two-component system cell cycle sensor histidine kinase/response regulator CckA
MIETNEISITNPEGSRELIMMVDDDAMVTMLVKRVLSLEGYRIITASDPMEALDIYARMGSQVEFVILDFVMPTMDGFTLFCELRALNPKIRAALTSGFVGYEQMQEMLSQGLYGFIPKPLSQGKLLLKVRSMLDSLEGDPRAVEFPAANR